MSGFENVWHEEITLNTQSYSVKHQTYFSLTRKNDIKLNTSLIIKTNKTINKQTAKSIQDHVAFPCNFLKVIILSLNNA